VKFEEDVEEGANRWSKPHVSSLSLHSLMELRSVNTMGSWRRRANRWSKPHVSSLSLHSLMELRSVNTMGSWRRRPTGGANHMFPPSPFTSSWSSGQSTSWDPGEVGQ
jgi:hypothetical protein